MAAGESFSYGSWFSSAAPHFSTKRRRLRCWRNLEVWIGACAQVMTDARVRLIQSGKADFPHRHGEIGVDEVNRVKSFIL